MTIIELGNIYSKVIKPSAREVAVMDSALSVETPGASFASSYRSGHWDGMTRFYKKQGNKFPTGLLSEVVPALRRIGIEPEIQDKRNIIGYNLDDEVKLAHAELGEITLRDYQYDSVRLALESTRGIINVATNGGKTEIACGIIQSIIPQLKDGQKVAFFTHSKEIFSQSAKRIQERLGMKIGLIGGGKWDEQQVNVVMIPTISKYIKEPKELPKIKKLKELQAEAEGLSGLIRTKGIPEKKLEQHRKEYENVKKKLDTYKKGEWDKIKASVKKTNEFLSSVVAFLGDEVHHASSDTWYQVFMGLENAYYRFGLTGTVDEKDAINMKRLLGCTGKIVKKVSNEFLIENGYSAKPTIHLLDIDAEALDNCDYATARDKGIINNYKRNRLFVDKVLQRAKFGKQSLIIVNETEHGNNVLSMFEDTDLNVKFSHGKNTDKHREDVLDELKSGKLDVLIATPILDEGVDVSGINCLFLMAGGKSMRQLLQRIGRGLRKKSDGSGLEVYDALDYHNEYLAEHTLERYQTYKAEGFEIYKK